MRVAPMPSTTGAVADVDALAPRRHGDSYSDVGAREAELGATASTHAGGLDRRAEEPSEASVDAPDADDAT